MLKPGLSHDIWTPRNMYQRWLRLGILKRYILLHILLCETIVGRGKESLFPSLPLVHSFIFWYLSSELHWYCASVSASQHSFLFSLPSCWVCVVLCPWPGCALLFCYMKVQLFTTALPFFSPPYFLMFHSFLGSVLRMTWTHFPIFPNIPKYLEHPRYAVCNKLWRLNHHSLWMNAPPYFNFPM